MKATVKDIEYSKENDYDFGDDGDFETCKIKARSLRHKITWTRVYLQKLIVEKNHELLTVVVYACLLYFILAIVNYIALSILNVSFSGITVLVISMFFSAAFRYSRTCEYEKVAEEKLSRVREIYKKDRVVLSRYFVYDDDLSEDS